MRVNSFCEGSCSAKLNWAVFKKDESGALFGCCESSAGCSKTCIFSFISVQLEYPKVDHFIKQLRFP